MENKTHIYGLRTTANREDQVFDFIISKLKKETKQVVGVLTRNDIFKNPDEDQLALIMSQDFHWVEKEQDVRDAAKLLYEHRIHGLPVLNNRKNQKKQIYLGKKELFKS